MGCARMRDRFPPDLLVVVVGPIVALVVAMLVASLLFHAMQWSSTTLALFFGAAVLVFSFALFVFLRRRRGS